MVEQGTHARQQLGANPRSAGIRGRLAPTGLAAALILAGLMPSFAGAQDLPRGMTSTTQLQNVFANYPVRPAWKVAGVDYAAGIPAGTVLRDPATLNIPGVSVDPSQHQIVVSGDNVVLDSYDFSLEGGWGLYITGANVIIDRCNFEIGANNMVPVNAGTSAANLTVERTTINGGGLGVTGNSGAIWAVISADGPGLTVTHTWLYNTPADAIDYNGSGTLIVRHNLFAALGWTPGAHPDSIQFTRGTVNNAIISYNTVYYPQPVNGMPEQMGEALQVEAQLGGAIYNTLLQNNTVIATGPIQTAPYLIAVRQDANSILDGIIVRGNFMDPTGSYGPFYTPSGSNLTYADNMNLTTGEAFPNP